MHLDDLNTNMEIDIPPAVIDRERMMDFAWLYDPIPLHCDEEYVKSARFGGLIAPGVMSFLAVWAKFVEDDMFGDVLTGKVRITAITGRNAYNGIAEIRIEAYNRHGELVLTNITESVVKYREE